MTAIQNINPYLLKISRLLLLAMVFTLPLSLFLNNLFLSIFLALFGIYTVLNFSSERLKKKGYLLLILNIPIIILLIGLLYSPEYNQGLKDLGRLVPLFFMVWYAIANPEFFNKLLRSMLYALVAGCLIAAVICWGGAFIELIETGGSLLDIISKEYAYHNLSERIGIHTPYLALFINTAIGFCVWSLSDAKRKIPKWSLLVVALILSLFLFNLMARNAIFCYVFFGIIYLIKEKKFGLLLLFTGVLVTLSVYTFSTEKNFMRDRFFKSVNVFENETIFSKKDGRFNRWEASYQVFKDFPIIGPGTANEDKYRKEQYYINRDSAAYNENYNAHNQFMEYLSTYGLLGGIAFVILFGVLFKTALDKKSFFLVFIVGCFFIANLTESLLERSWGIVYYIVLLLLVLNWDESITLKKRENV